jgi:hypothetical protein
LSQTHERNNLQWFGVLATLVCLALLVLMLFAMFTTRNSDSAYHRNDSYRPAEQLKQFQENAGKAIHRAFGEVL